MPFKEGKSESQQLVPERKKGDWHPRQRKCPKCGLISPEKSIRCDCGYEFDASAIGKSKLNKPVEIKGTYDILEIYEA